jgi:hypothetical protein
MLRRLLRQWKQDSELTLLDLNAGSAGKAQLYPTSKEILAGFDRSTVPPPDSPLTPILLAARWIIGDLHGEQMPAIAADLLEAGFDSPTLVRLAGEMQIRSSADAEPLVGMVFQELGVPWPFSDLRAKLIITRNIAREVMAGNRDLYSALSHLEYALWDWRSTTKDLQMLFGLKDDLSWDPNINAMSQQF